MDSRFKLKKFFGFGTVYLAKRVTVCTAKGTFRRRFVAGDGGWS